MSKLFTPRLTAPATNNKYFIHTSKAGYNACILINKATGSCLPNCVGYAWGRAYEAWGQKPRLSRSNAENWYLNTGDGYKRGKTPKIGSIICWRKGKAGYAADGAGHVAFVEKVNADGSIVVSNSNYSGTRFFTRTIKGPKWEIGTGLTFQGFIYPPVTFVLAKPKSAFKISDADYPVKIKKGNYFTITGTITSALKMSRVVVAILDSKGAAKFKFTAAPNTKSWNIHKADNAMMFRKLGKGTYTYRITAWDSNGAHVVLSKTFKVV